MITTNGMDKLSDHAIDIFSIVLELNKDCLLLYPDEDCININEKGIVQILKLLGIENFFKSII